MAMTWTLNLDEYRARAQRVLDGSQTGQYTKRAMAHDLLALAAEIDTMREINAELIRRSNKRLDLIEEAQTVLRRA
jgi:hypothetical protein